MLPRQNKSLSIIYYLFKVYRYLKMTFLLCYYICPDRLILVFLQLIISIILYCSGGRYNVTILKYSSHFEIFDIVWNKFLSFCQILSLIWSTVLPHSEITDAVWNTNLLQFEINIFLLYLSLRWNSFFFCHYFK